MNKKYNNNKIVDLFCGPGGLSLGFEKAGFEVVLANDNDESSIKTYLSNRPSLNSDNVLLDDIENFLNKKKDILKQEDISVVAGGPPCQGFSMANRQRIINDPRNILYRKFIEVIKISKPKIFIMENVKGMLPHAEEIVGDFKKIGYIAKYEIFNAKDFGIPQNRERLIYIGAKKDILNKKPNILKEIFNNIQKAKTKNIVPLSEAFWGLRKIKARTEKGNTNIESAVSGFTKDKIFSNNKPNKYILRINNNRNVKSVFNHKARYNNNRDLEIYRLLPPGGKSDHENISHIMPYKKRAHIFKDKYYKLDPRKVSKTITSHMKFDCNMYIHPFEDRGITPREAARIQSFPDDYIFEGPYTHWYAQIGNAVPPLLGEVIAKSIKKYL